MTQVTRERVSAAYAALASGDESQISEYWAEDLRWLVPGHNQLSGWKNSRAEFLDFMAKVGTLSGNSFRMDPVATMITEDCSADVTHNLGRRADDPNRVLDIDVIHFMRWRDGKVIEAKGAIFGDGTEKYDEFWG